MLVGYFSLAMLLKALTKDRYNLMALFACIGLPSVIWNLMFFLFIDERDAVVHYSIFVPPMHLCQVAFWVVFLCLKCGFRLSWGKAFFYAILTQLVTLGDFLVWDGLQALEAGVVAALVEFFLYMGIWYLLYVRSEKRQLVTKDWTIVVLGGMSVFAFVNIYEESGPIWTAGTTLLECILFTVLGYTFEMERRFSKAEVLKI